MSGRGAPGSATASRSRCFPATSSFASRVRFHPDGWCLASGGNQPGDVKLWDLTREPEYLPVWSADAQALAFDAGGDRLRLVGILGERWDALAVVPDREVEAIQRVARSRVPVMAHPHLREGQRVRVTCGPLADVEGILARQEPHRGVLVLSVELLRRSVAVEVDCTWVVPA